LLPTISSGGTPRFEVEIELELVDDELLEPHQLSVCAFAFEFPEAVKLAPLPDNRAHNIRQKQAVHQLRKYEYFHIRKRYRGRIFLQFVRIHSSFTPFIKRSLIIR